MGPKDFDSLTKDQFLALLAENQRYREALEDIAAPRDWRITDETRWRNDFHIATTAKERILAQDMEIEALKKELRR